MKDKINEGIFLVSFVTTTKTSLRKSLFMVFSPKSLHFYQLFPLKNDHNIVSSNVFLWYPSGYFCDLPQRLFLHCVIILHSSHSLTCIPPDHIKEIQKEKTKVLFWVQLPHHLTYKLSLSKFGLSRFRNVCELTTRHLVAETLISYFANDEKYLHSSPILFCKFDIIRKSWTLKLKTGKIFYNFSSL